jgi:hypothetical protein
LQAENDRHSENESNENCDDIDNESNKELSIESTKDHQTNSTEQHISIATVASSTEKRPQMNEEEVVVTQSSGRSCKQCGKQSDKGWRKVDGDWYCLNHGIKIRVSNTRNVEIDQSLCHFINGCGFFPNAS